MAKVTEIAVGEEAGLRGAPSRPGGVVRCALYTRTSTAEGLEGEVNSLEVQREAAESYVASQAHEGWVALPARYDDGGHSGASVKRPALQRLLADIEAGRVDCVVVYKVDRLSRSLTDFARLVEVFETCGVELVSVTQEFSSTNPLRRFLLNVLLSFAQFERELASDRMRDKIGSVRRQGKWYGSRPALGYDVDRRTHRLVVNDEEAERVRAIFGLYLEHGTATAVAEELHRRGWRNKDYVSLKGVEHRGGPFTPTQLHRLLTRVAYLGKVEYKGVIYPGEHEAIVDEAVWQRVQELRRARSRTWRRPGRRCGGGWLEGLLHCAACGAPMTHRQRTGSQGKDDWHGRYYACVDGRGRVHRGCPTRSVPAGVLEAKVVGCLRERAAQSREVAQRLREAREAAAERVATLAARHEELTERLARLKGETVRLAGLLARREPAEADEDDGAARLHEQMQAAETAIRGLRAERVSLHRLTLEAQGAAKALLLFDDAWDTLPAHHQRRAVQLLLERVDYDPRTEEVSVRPRGLGEGVLRPEASPGHEAPSGGDGHEESDEPR
ncbi:MAG: recombinase family protein [bacterium]